MWSKHHENVKFQKKSGKLWTYLSDMNGRKTQVDYILVNKKWKNSVHNVEAYNSFASIGSDHRLLTAKIRLSLRKSKTPEREKSYDWSTLKNEDLQKLYTLTVRNRYATLSIETDDISDNYAKFIQANKEATEQLIPTKKKSKKKEISDDPR